MSALRFIAMAHSITAPMRWRTHRAVWTFTCQIGVSTSRRSALVTSETGRLPTRGKAWRSRLFSQVRAWIGAAPAGPLLLDDAGRGGGEGRHALGAALLGQGIAALAGELAVRERPVPRFAQ